MTVDEELNLLDDSLRRLKIEYDVFFGGGSKKPPADLEWRVQSLIKKYSDGKRMNFAQRFRYGTISQRYALFNNLWQQKVRIKEEGYRRPQDAWLSVQGVRQFDEELPAEKAAAHHFSLQFSDIAAEKDKVRALFDAMVKARKLAGNAGGGAGNFESFEAFVQKKTEQIRSEYKCSAVEYSIEMENGQVRLKAKAGKK